MNDNYIVQSVPYSIKLVPEGDPRLEDAYGRTYFDSHTILLCADSPRQERLETLLHETMHIIVGGREKVDLTQEDDLRWFSAMLADTLLRNGIMA